MTQDEIKAYAAAGETGPFRLITVADYAPFIGAEAVARILAKAAGLAGRRIAHINSTYYGGGVAQILSSLTLLMNACGLRTEWRVIEGAPDFFSVTKKMHNALQGGPIRLSELKMRIYERVAFENAARLHLDHDYVIVHDPQPLPLERYCRRTGPWIWRCHVDLTRPDEELWRYLAPFIERYDAVVLSLPEYAQKISTPQRFIAPAIDPFSTTNQPLSEAEVDERLAHYGIPTDLPLVVQVSRFDRWKDPHGVLEAFRRVVAERPATLALVGNVATDDPEGQAVFESLCSHREARVHILSVQDSALVNALQRRAAVVVQKSLREGFGLTVTEAMWKGAAVVAGNVGGIKHQIVDGENGFLVDSVESAAARITQLLADQGLRDRIGLAARETVAQRFLLTRLLEDWLDLFASFRTHYELRGAPDD